MQGHWWINCCVSKGRVRIGFLKWMNITVHGSLQILYQTALLHMLANKCEFLFWGRQLRYGWLAVNGILNYKNNEHISAVLGVITQMCTNAQLLFACSCDAPYSPSVDQPIIIVAVRKYQIFSDRSGLGKGLRSSLSSSPFPHPYYCTIFVWYRYYLGQLQRYLHWYNKNKSSIVKRNSFWKPK